MEFDLDRTTPGSRRGCVGVVISSRSLPATRVAVLQFDPVFLTAARAAIAGALALCLLIAFKQKRPTRADIASLVVVSLGVVVGFPLLTAFALQHVTSAHSIVFIGLLPLATAIFGVIRGGERPKPAFWAFSVLGSALVAGFALSPGPPSSPIGATLRIRGEVVCGSLGQITRRRLDHHPDQGLGSGRADQQPTMAVQRCFRPPQHPRDGERRGGWNRFGGGGGRGRR